MANVVGESNDNDLAGVSGKNSVGGRGVEGFSETFQGVFDHSSSNAGVVGESDQFDGVFGVSHKNTAAGISGHNENGGFGVFGESKNGGRGVAGFSDTFQGVYGSSRDNAGVVGESTNFDGVFGLTNKATAAGISGHNDAGTAVWGGSKSGRGVAGFSESWQGVYGHSVSQAGIVGESDKFVGVWAESHDLNQPAVLARNTVKDGRAAHFEGNMSVTGDISFANADCAEDFYVSEVTQVEPGTVMVIGEDGVLHPSLKAYDKKVVGVVSGAGDLKPAIVLDKCQSSKKRQPIALLGKVFCKVDAEYGAIEVGDLLTSSSTPGHAMKASDPLRVFGTVIGKALRTLDKGKGLIPILIALQ